MARRGPKRGGADTRGAIRRAAGRQFAAHGYEGATMRSIAAEAGVDPALVAHFFGSKDELFAACVRWPLDPAVELPRLLADGPEGIARKLVPLFVTMCEQEDRRALLALLRSAPTHARAEQLLRGSLTSDVMRALAAALALPDAELRVNMATAHLLGLAMTRYVLRLEPLASAPPEAVIACAIPAVESCFAPAASAAVPAQAP